MGRGTKPTLQQFRTTLASVLDSAPESTSQESWIEFSKRLNSFAVEISSDDGNYAHLPRRERLQAACQLHSYESAVCEEHCKGAEAWQVAVAKRLLGDVYVKLHETDKAEEVYQAGLKSLGPTMSAFPFVLERQRLLCNLGLLFLDHVAYATPSKAHKATIIRFEALPYLRDSCRVAREMKTLAPPSDQGAEDIALRCLCESFRNLANAMGDMKDWPGADRYYSLAWRKAEKLKHHQMLDQHVAISISRAVLALEEGRESRIKQCEKECDDISRKTAAILSIRNRRGEILHTLAKLRIHRGMFPKAKQLLKQAVRLLAAGSAEKIDCEELTKVP